MISTHRFKKKFITSKEVFNQFIRIYFLHSEKYRRFDSGILQLLDYDFFHSTTQLLIFIGTKSVTRSGDFWKFLWTNFGTKVAQIISAF